jgi:hypothetical protein
MPTRERHRGSSIHWIAAALATAMALDETFDNERPPRTTGDQAHGVRRGSLRSFASRSEVTERNLGLSAQSPMPSGRQLGILRWRHDMNHPPTWLTTIWIWDRCRARQVRQKPKTARFYCGQIDSRMRNRLPQTALGACLSSLPRRFASAFSFGTRAKRRLSRERSTATCCTVPSK